MGYLNCKVSIDLSKAVQYSDTFFSHFTKILLSNYFFGIKMPFKDWPSFWGSSHFENQTQKIQCWDDPHCIWKQQQPKKPCKVGGGSCVLNRKKDSHYVLVCCTWNPDTPCNFRSWNHCTVVIHSPVFQWLNTSGPEMVRISNVIWNLD